ncbi:MAG: SWEET family sugar transporter [Lactococcus sp.]|nr:MULTISPECIES: SemiSWEET family transporter [Lactococcus]MDN5402920.1 SWEET family sugar transporter [Lactococcus sp.]MDN5409507.1 SWEET family sugar transporter [Lactococcus sp.]MDN5410831.1 SWEET family sugar transporter [Lactococcus sp.]MDN5435295.1 SWEET family sugar transporter [Lactococcus sp.]MDN5461659.1 SWEET family sugar transporter [Lactococcus sp.]
MMKNKVHLFIGSVGATIGLFVFLAYIPQIISNLNGDKSQPWQPLIAAISCLVWVLYGLTNQPKRDYILIIPNTLGVILGTLTFLTSL